MSRPLEQPNDVSSEGCQLQSFSGFYIAVQRVELITIQELPFLFQNGKPQTGFEYVFSDT